MAKRPRRPADGSARLNPIDVTGFTPVTASSLQHPASSLLPSPHKLRPRPHPFERAVDRSRTLWPGAVADAQRHRQHLARLQDDLAGFELDDQPAFENSEGFIHVREALPGKTGGPTPKGNPQH